MDIVNEEGEERVGTLVCRNIELMLLKGINHMAPQ